MITWHRRMALNIANQLQLARNRHETKMKFGNDSAGMFHLSSPVKESSCAFPKPPSSLDHFLLLLLLLLLLLRRCFAR